MPALAIIALLLALFAPTLFILSREWPCTHFGDPAIGCVAAVAAIVFGQMAVAETIPRGGSGRIGRIVARGAQALGGLTLAVCIAVCTIGPGHYPAIESATIGEIRSVISAQAAYQPFNGGYYDTIECLQAPSTCIPGYAASPAPTFLDPSVARSTLAYEWTFHPGPPAPEEAVRGGKISPSSLTSWALVAVPVQRGRFTCLGFCGDHSGRICVRDDGTAPPVVDGSCGPSCRFLK